jgi:flavodoxin
MKGDYMKHKTLIIFYSHSGVTKRIAQILLDITDGDLFEIKTKRTYDSDMWKAWDEAQEEIKDGILPELDGTLPDLTDYDEVIVGGPVWGFTLANPVLAFMRNIDLTGKKVTSFWTFYDHDEKYNNDMKKEAMGANIFDGLSLPRSITCNENKMHQAVDKWLQRFKEWKP